MTTIKEIAKTAGVSIGTVDRVIHNRGMVNEQTKERILSVMKELNYKPNHAAQGLAVRKKKLKLCFLIPDAKKNPFFLKVREAAEKKAEELKQYGVQVSFITLKADQNHEFHPEENFMEKIEQQDGIAVLGIKIAEMTKCLDEAERLGIPVVFYNTMIDGRKFLAYVGCDYGNSGKLAAGLSALIGGEDAKVCIYSEKLPEITSYFERLNGFQTEMQKRYPAMQILDIREISKNQTENEQSVQDMLEKFPDVNVVYVINPADYGICEAISRTDEKHQIRIITNDLVKEQITMIQQGIISATVCQEPEKQGAQPLDILFRYLAFGVVPENKICYTNLSIHIAQNI